MRDLNSAFELENLVYYNTILGTIRSFRASCLCLFNQTSKEPQRKYNQTQILIMRLYFNHYFISVVVNYAPVCLHLKKYNYLETHDGSEMKYKFSNVKLKCTQARHKVSLRAKH